MVCEVSQVALNCNGGVLRTGIGVSCGDPRRFMCNLLRPMFRALSGGARSLWD